MSRILRSVALAAIAAVSVAAQAPAPSWLDRLDGIVGTKRTVVFGEDSHGMAAVHAAVPPMFERLVTRKGFRVFVFEVQWNVTDAFRDFMASDRTTLNTMEQFYLDGAFVSDDIAAMLVWIRTWNRTHPKDQIGIYGYQPEQPVTDSRALVSFLGRYGGTEGQALTEDLKACRTLDPAIKTDLDMVIANGKLNKAGKASYTDEQLRNCLAAIDRTNAYIRQTDAEPGSVPKRDRLLARLHALSLRTYVDLLRREVDGYFTNPNQTNDQQIAGQRRLYGGGDKTRFDILQNLRAEFFPGKKTFFWMHDWHAARHASEMDVVPGTVGIPKDTVSIGERIYAAAPKDTVVIGNLVPCDKRCEEPAGSVEPAFAQRFGDRTVLIDMRDPREARGLPIRQAGSFYANQNRIPFGNIVLARQFDAILYVPKTDPVH